MPQYRDTYDAAYPPDVEAAPMIQRAAGSDPLVPEPMKGRTMATPDAATMRKLQAQGKALRNASGNPSFQVRNADDLDNAIRAVGRVKPDTEEARSRVRRYLIGRAKALGLSSRIPDNWAADGSLKDDGDSSSDTGPGADPGMDSKAARVFSRRKAASGSAST